MILVRVPDPDAARERARQILDQRRFGRATEPKPLAGPLRWLGDRLEGVANWLDDRLHDLFHLLPGGWGPILGIAICVLVVGLIAWTVGRSARRVSRPDREAGAPTRSSTDPRELEREADDADRAGDYERAVRLRFRAGLIRLDHARAIELRPWTTNTVVARRVASDRFDDLSLAFDGIVYGGRDATPSDSEIARAEWPRLLDEVRAR